MDVQRLLRLNGIVKASIEAADDVGGKGLVASYGRIRNEIVDALGAEHGDELARLFPAELETDGRPWGWQEQEVKTLLVQLAGWIDGVIEGEILGQRIQAEAEAKVRRVGFQWERALVRSGMLQHAPHRSDGGASDRPVLLATRIVL